MRLTSPSSLGSVIRASTSPGSPEEEEEEEEERRASFLSDVSLEPQVQARDEGEGFVVSLVPLRDQRAERSTFTVGAGGSIDIDHEVIADGLPLPVIR